MRIIDQTPAYFTGGFLFLSSTRREVSPSLSQPGSRKKTTFELPEPNSQKPHSLPSSSPFSLFPLPPNTHRTHYPIPFHPPIPSTLPLISLPYSNHRLGSPSNLPPIGGGGPNPPCPCPSPGLICPPPPPPGGGNPGNPGGGIPPGGGNGGMPLGGNGGAGEPAW